MAKLLNLQNKDAAESNAAESSVNIFEDTTAEKWGNFYKSKAIGVLSAANTNAASESSEFDSLAMSGSADQAIQMTIEAYAEGKTINVKKFENYIFRLFELGELNGLYDRRWCYLAKSLEAKNRRGKSLLDEAFLTRLGQLVGVNPVLDFLDDRNFSRDKFVGYFQNMDIRNLDQSALAQANASWFVRDVSQPNSDADLRANKLDLTKIDRDDAGVLPLLVSSEKLKQIVSKRFSVDDRFIENLVGSFKTNYDETVRFIAEIKSSYNAPDYYNQQLLKLGKMLKTYGTAVASESFEALPENLTSQTYSKSQIRTQIVSAIQSLTGLSSNNPQELLNSNAFESVTNLERLASGSSYSLAA